MKRKNTTRNALLTSILSLLLCVSLLVGATFAWFTDSVVSGTNTIAAGNLDVELYHSDKNDSGYVDAETKLFNDVTKWEPGVVVYENFKVENVGDLALKYQLSIRFENETKVTVDGVEHGLSEVLKVGVVKGGFTGGRAEAQNIAFDKSLSTFDLSGVLEGNTTSETYGVVIYWAPNANEVDNIFNMNNENKGKVLSIDLGINLFATQEVYEADSFGDDYDAGLILPELGEDIVLVEKDGIQYYYDEAGNYVLYLVTDAYTKDTVNVAEGVDAIGNYAFTYNKNVKTVVLSSTVKSLGRGFDSSAVEKVVLNEGLEKIDSRAFRATTALKEVVIPSTVKVIEDNAFQKSVLKEIVIPATVETVGEAAFGASKIETVTFEGNTSIQGYAFRGCTALCTVTMKGDDVTFIPSTLNGRNSMWFCNGESNNANTSDIDFYVVNAMVAARVKTAMGAEANNTDVYIIGGESQTTFVTAKNAKELQTALDNASGATIISFTADIKGDVVATQKTGANVTIDGGEKKFTGVMTVFGNGNQSGAETLTIRNINFVAANGASSCIVSPDRSVNNKYSYAHNITVANCSFTDSDGTVNCAAVRTEDGGDKNWVISDCAVDNTMHSLLQVQNIEGKLTVTGCTVNSKNGANLNSTTNFEMDSCNFDVTGYAVRYGVNSGGNPTEAKNFVLKNSTLKSANDEGDAVIIFRTSAQNAVMDLVNTTLIGDPQISGNTDATTVLVNGAFPAANSEELKAVLKNNVTVSLSAGEYSLPTLSKKEGVTIIGDENGGTVIGGSNATTGFGGNFGKNTTIKNVTFSGSTNGVRYSYAQGGTTVFENCTFAGDATYGFHIDESKGATFIFKNCTFVGFNAFAGDLESVTFENCKFKSNGNYGHTNIWSVAYFNNCIWDDGVTYGGAGNSYEIWINGVKQ